MITLPELPKGITFEYDANKFDSGEDYASIFGFNRNVRLATLNVRWCAPHTEKAKAIGQAFAAVPELLDALAKVLPFLQDEMERRLNTDARLLPAGSKYHQDAEDAVETVRAALRAAGATLSDDDPHGAGDIPQPGDDDFVFDAPPPPGTGFQSKVSQWATREQVITAIASAIEGKPEYVRDEMADVVDAVMECEDVLTTLKECMPDAEYEDAALNLVEIYNNHQEAEYTGMKYAAGSCGGGHGQAVHEGSAFSSVDSAVIAAMHRYGGGFVQQVAVAYGHADTENQNRLKAAFPDLWQRYAIMAGMEGRAQ